MLKVRYVLVVVIFAACSGDEPEDTICDKAASCLGLTAEEKAECRTAAAQAPSGVLAECAACVSDHTCSQIGGEGACDQECAGIDFQGVPTREENATTICERAASCGFNTPPTCVSDVVNGPRPDEVVARCAECASVHTCAELDVGACDVACT